MGRRPIADPADTIPGDRILKTLKRYPALTLRQLNNVLGYSRKGKLLEKYVRRLAAAGKLGNQNVLKLAMRGAVEGEIVVTQKPQVYSDFWLKEQLSIAEILIALELFSVEAEVELLATLSEVELRARPIRVSLPTGASAKVVPDGYVAYRFAAGDELGIVLDEDGGTEKYDVEHQVRTIKRKIEQLVWMGEQRAYLQVFPTETLQSAWVVRAGIERREERLRQLLTWTELTLTEMDREYWGEFFCFTTADPKQMTPSEFVTGNHWITPFTYQQGPLVAL